MYIVMKYCYEYRGTYDDNNFDFHLCWILSHRFFVNYSLGVFMSFIICMFLFNVF